MAEAVRKAMRGRAERRVLEPVPAPTGDTGDERSPLAPAPRGRGRRNPGDRRRAEHLNGDDRPPAADEIIVRVHACGLNHVEVMSEPSVHGTRYICGVDAAGTVIAAGHRVTRFAVGDEVFGHFLSESRTWAQAPCARTIANGPHVERRPTDLDPVAAAVLAGGGLAAKTIVRAAGLQPGQTALVIGATSNAGTVLVPLLADAGAYVIAVAAAEDDDYVRSLGAAETIDEDAPDPVAEALGCRAEVDLIVDLVRFGEPYFITAAACHGTIVTAIPGAGKPGIPRIGITAEPGDLAALAQRALGRDRASAATDRELSISA
jgi:NADPH2:quinone reductase